MATLCYEFTAAEVAAFFLPENSTDGLRARLSRRLDVLEKQYAQAQQDIEVCQNLFNKECEDVYYIFWDETPAEKEAILNGSAEARAFRNAKRKLHRIERGIQRVEELLVNLEGL